MSEPAAPKRTTSVVLLEEAIRRNKVAVQQHNILATEVRAYQKTLADQTAQSQTPHAIASKELSEGYRRAIADTTAEINKRAPALRKLREAVETSEEVVHKLQAQVAHDNEASERFKKSQPRKDNIEDDAQEEIVVTGRRFQEVEAKDHRVRLSAFVGQELEVYGPADPTKNVLAPLHATQGLLFPYTPTISQSQDTSWQTSDLEHANYDILSFQKSSSANITLTAKFTAQNQREAEYMFAAIHFLRTVSKAYFGEKDSDQFLSREGEGDNADADDASSLIMQRVGGKAGLPPPVLILSGYGTLMFNNIRCVVKSHSWSFEENSDMVRVRLPVGETVWLPPLLQITITLGMQSNTDDLRETFSLDEFRTGALLRGKRKGWF